MRTIRSVCVYCASSSRVAPVYFEAAQALGRLLAREEIRCIYGAGGQGLMGALADAVMQEGGEITGVIPQFMYDNGWNHPRLEKLVITPDIHSRKQRMADLSDAVIALPGGCGTLEELLEAITWKQLGLYLHPIVLLNTRGYYDPLLQVFSRAVDEHFMGLRHASIWHVASTPDEALELIHSLPQWDSSVHKFAAL